MGPGARTIACLAALLLLAPERTRASDTDDAPAELADDEGKPEEESDEMLTHTDEEWAQMKKDLLDSLPDDNETEDEGGEPDEDARWHITGGYPFIEYEGFLQDDDKRDASKMNLHKGNMTLTEAKLWCAEKKECVGFNHAGEPSDGPFEVFFKDYWSLSVETEDLWTSYEKGEQLENEAPPAADDDGEHLEITAESIMEEYGVDMEEFHRENSKREFDKDSGNHNETHQKIFHQEM